MSSARDLALDRMIDWAGPVEILAPPKKRASRSAYGTAVLAGLLVREKAAEFLNGLPALRHLPGQHSQASHGGGGSGAGPTGVESGAVGSSGGAGGGGSGAPDRDGNYEEDGVSYDADGNRLTDSYISEYGKPVTYSNVGNHSLVLSQRGEYHIMRDRPDPTEPHSLVREPRDVKVTGLTQSDVRTIGDDAGPMADAEKGDSRRTAAGLTLTADGNERLTLSDGGSFSMRGNAVDMADAFDTMDDAYDRYYEVGSR